MYIRILGREEEKEMEGGRERERERKEREKMDEKLKDQSLYCPF